MLHHWQLALVLGWTRWSWTSSPTLMVLRISVWVKCLLHFMMLLPRQGIGEGKNQITWKESQGKAFQCNYLKFWWSPTSVPFLLQQPKDQRCSNYPANLYVICWTTIYHNIFLAHCALFLKDRSSLSMKTWIILVEAFQKNILKWPGKNLNHANATYLFCLREMVSPPLSASDI